MTLYSFLAGTAELERSYKAVEAGTMHVPIAAEYPLADAAQAHQRLEPAIYSARSPCALANWMAT